MAEGEGYTGVSETLLPEGDRDGATYASIDYSRLNKQAADVFRVILDGRWWSLAQIASATGHGEASISARLRDFRKERFGRHTVERVRHPEVQELFLYRLTVNQESNDA